MVRLAPRLTAQICTYLHTERFPEILVAKSYPRFLAIDPLKALISEVSPIHSPCLQGARQANALLPRRPLRHQSCSLLHLVQSIHCQRQLARQVAALV